MKRLLVLSSLLVAGCLPAGLGPHWERSGCPAFSIVYSIFAVPGGGSRTIASFTFTEDEGRGELLASVEFGPDDVHAILPLELPVDDYTDVRRDLPVPLTPRRLKEPRTGHAIELSYSGLTKAARVNRIHGPVISTKRSRGSVRTRKFGPVEFSAILHSGQREFRLGSAPPPRSTPQAKWIVWSDQLTPEAQSAVEGLSQCALGPAPD